MTMEATASRPRARGHAIAGLYAITPDGDPGDVLAGVVAALAGGARVIQLRRKHDDAALRLKFGKALRKLTVQNGATLIVNDDLSLAHAIGADGVHWGHDDVKDLAASISAVRAVEKAGGRRLLVGISCYNDYRRAHAAVAAGADYIAFGSFFPSGTKPDAVRATLSLLQRARRELPVPVVAIGGITSDNAGVLVAAGASAVAVIGDLFHGNDAATIERRARAFTDLFS